MQLNEYNLVIINSSGGKEGLLLSKDDYYLRAQKDVDILTK